MRCAGRRFETSTERCGAVRPTRRLFLRPTNSFDVTSSYFLPNSDPRRRPLRSSSATGGARAHSTSLNHRGGYVDARFTNGVAANAADIWRDGSTPESHLEHAGVLPVRTRSPRTSFTLNLGFAASTSRTMKRWRRRVPANPFFPHLDAGRSTSRARDAGVSWTDFSHRASASRMT